MTLKTRIEKLETAQGIGAHYGYMLVISNGWADWKSPGERAKGYKIQPYIKSAGGTGGEPFYLATIQEVAEFSNRPDVELNIFIIGELTPEESAALGEVKTIEGSDESQDTIDET